MANASDESKDKPSATDPFSKAGSGDGEDSGPEETVWEETYSAKEIIETWLVLIPLTILIAGGTIYLVYNVETVVAYSYYAWLILALVLVLMWGIPMCKVAYKKMSYHYKLTTERLIHREGFFVRQTDQVELFDIRDVSFRQNLIESFLGVGTIVIESVDKSHPKLELEGIQNVKERTDDIDRMRRKIQEGQRLRMDS